MHHASRRLGSVVASLLLSAEWVDRARAQAPVSSGTIITIAGNGSLGFTGDDGPATSASFNGPLGMAVGPDGTLYIADEGNNRIRAVDPTTGIISTVAGNGLEPEFDAANGEERKTKRSRTRVVVFHAITQELKGGYYGILTQGFPQLVRVNADVLGLETEQPLPTHFPALCRARMIHEYPVIPDVERLEKMIAEVPLN